MDRIASFLPLAIPVILAPFFVPMVLRMLGEARTKRSVMTRGEPGMARITAVAQIGTTVNQVPDMRLVLDIERAGAPPRRVTMTRLVDLGSMPRAGDRVYALIDPDHPDRVLLMPSPTGAGMENPGQNLTFDHDLVRDTVALSPRLREHRKYGIATVASLSPTATSATEIVLDIEAIGAPRRRLTITQIIDGPPPSVGDRVYLLMDPDNPDIVSADAGVNDRRPEAPHQCPSAGSAGVRTAAAATGRQGRRQGPVGGATTAQQSGA